MASKKSPAKKKSPAVKAPPFGKGKMGKGKGKPC